MDIKSAVDKHKRKGSVLGQIGAFKGYNTMDFIARLLLLESLWYRLGRKY